MKCNLFINKNGRPIGHPFQNNSLLHRVYFKSTIFLTLVNDPARIR